MEPFEIILAVVAIVGCLAFVLAVRKMTRTEAPKSKKQHKKTKKKDKTKQETEIPKEWRKEKGSNPFPTKSTKPSRWSLPHFKGPEKIHVPGLRLFKRILAGILTLINFFVMCATLMSNPNTQPLFWLFALNFFILLDYMWKTGRGKID